MSNRNVVPKNSLSTLGTIAKRWAKVFCSEIDIDGVVYNAENLVGPQGEQGIQGIQGPVGDGTGDMLAANNLSDVDDVNEARDNLNIVDYELPIATAISLGGIRTPSGAPGEFVSGFDVDGIALYDTPAGEGALKNDGSVDGTGFQQFLGLKFDMAVVEIIVSDEATAPSSYIKLAAQSGLTDNLETLFPDTGGSSLVLLRADVGDTITLKHAAGNILLWGGADIELSGTKTIFLVFDGANWNEIGNVSSAASLLINSSVAGTGIQELAGINLKDETVLTITAGSVTATQSMHSISAQTGVTDDLDSIVPGKGTGDLIFISADAGDTITIRHNIGNIVTGDGENISLSGDKTLLLLKRASNWHVVGGSASSASGLMANASVAGTGIQEFLGVNLTNDTILTIVSGVVTATQSSHVIAAESGVTDDLTSIVAATGHGDLLIITADTGDIITVKHGVGNIVSATLTDVILDPGKSLFLVRRASVWHILSGGADAVLYEREDFSYEFGPYTYGTIFAFVVPKRGFIQWVEADVPVTGTSAVELDVIKNGVSMGTFLVSQAANSSPYVWGRLNTNFAVGAGDVISWGILNNGNGWGYAGSPASGRIRIGFRFISE